MGKIVDKPKSSLVQQLVGVTDVAQMLNLSTERVRQLAKAQALPEPAGRIGRQLLWKRLDVEAWGRQTGKLPDDGQGERQLLSARDVELGTMRLVVDEVMDWDVRLDSFCHVRIWAPLGEKEGHHVVVLGQLEDSFGRGITNDIEAVAMTVAAKYLGPYWRQARFFEYHTVGWPDQTDRFQSVTFTIRKLQRYGNRSNYLPVTREVKRELGAELTEPEWRQTSRADIEKLTGDTVKIWAPGTYTSELLRATRAYPSEKSELTWDPERAGDLSVLFSNLTQLATSNPTAIFELDFELSEKQIHLAQLLVAHKFVAALERSRHDARSQPTDIAIWLNPPSVTNSAEILGVAEPNAGTRLDSSEIWGLITSVRSAFANAMDPAQGSISEIQKLLIVPGLHGGWVPLNWHEAGIDEPTHERSGLFGSIGLPVDLSNSPIEASPIEPNAQLILLVDVAIEYLQETDRSFWRKFEVPAFVPSIPLPATGPLTRAYLDKVEWQPSSHFDIHQRRRLERGEFKAERFGLDPDGSLVAIDAKGMEFTCEWPVSGQLDPSLAKAAIRADRQSQRGATPVYIEDNDGHLHLLPSAVHRSYGFEYTWGYSGTGPTNLASSTLDLVSRALERPEISSSSAALELVRRIAQSPRIPDWNVAELIARILEVAVASNHDDIDSARSVPLT